MTRDLQPCTRDELARHLDALGIRPDTYDLYGRHPNDAWVMDRQEGGWVVFYTERGIEWDHRRFNEEADACAALLAEVATNDHAFFELVAGPAPTDEADNAFDDWLRDLGATR